MINIKKLFMVVISFVITFWFLIAGLRSDIFVLGFVCGMFLMISILGLYDVRGDVK